MKCIVLSIFIVLIGGLPASVISGWVAPASAIPITPTPLQVVPDTLRDTDTIRPPDLPGQIEQIEQIEQVQQIGQMGQDSATPASKESSARESYIRGLFHLENQAYNDALEDFQAAHTLLPDEPAFNHALSDAYRGLGDSMNAEYYAKIAVSLAPDNVWYHQALAKIYEDEARPDAVLDTYRNALAIHPNDLHLLEQLAEAYMQFGELLRANETYDQILAKRGGTSQIHMNKYWNFRALGRTDKALAELQAIRAIEPDNLPNLRLIASLYMETGQMDQALTILTELKNRNARDIQTMLMLVEFHLFQEDWDAAELAAETLIRDPFFYPSDKLELVQFVLTYLERATTAEGTPIVVGSPTELRERTQNLIQLFASEEPSYGPAQELLSQFYRTTGAATEELRQLSRVNRIMPDNEEAWQDRLRILFRESRFSELISVADTALTHHPENAELLYLSGASHLHLNQPAEAILQLEEASFSPAPRTLRATIHITLGDALLEQEMNEAELMHRVDDADGSQDTRHTNTPWTDAMLREAGRNYEQALRLIDGNPDALGSLAYLKALETEPGQPQQELLQEALDHWQEALDHWQQAPDHRQQARGTQPNPGHTTEALLQRKINRAQSMLEQANSEEESRP